MVTSYGMYARGLVAKHVDSLCLIVYFFMLNMYYICMVAERRHIKMLVITMCTRLALNAYQYVWYVYARKTIYIP